MNQATENRAVTILEGMKGLAPGQGPGYRAASEPPGQGAGVHFPGHQYNLAVQRTGAVPI